MHKKSKLKTMKESIRNSHNGQTDVIILQFISEFDKSCQNIGIRLPFAIGSLNISIRFCNLLSR